MSQYQQLQAAETTLYIVPWSLISLQRGLCCKWEHSDCDTQTFTFFLWSFLETTLLCFEPEQIGCCRLSSCTDTSHCHRARHEISMSISPYSKLVGFYTEWKLNDWVFLNWLKMPTIINYFSIVSAQALIKNGADKTWRSSLLQRQMWNCYCCGLPETFHTFWQRCLTLMKVRRSVKDEIWKEREGNPGWVWRMNNRGILIYNSLVKLFLLEIKFFFFVFNTKLVFNNIISKVFFKQDQLPCLIGGITRCKYVGAYTSLICSHTTFFFSVRKSDLAVKIQFY